MYSEKIVKNLKEIFALGYVPIRKNESYMFKLSNGLPAYSLVNCMGHAFFNLTNQILNDYQFDKEYLYSCQNFYDSFKSLNGMALSMFNFVEITGLKVEKAQKTAKRGNGEWNVALYFNTEIEDYHFLLQENAFCWSSKISINKSVEKFVTPPKVYRERYDLYDIYTIKNPHFHNLCK